MATKYSDTQKISRRLHFILLMLCIYCSFLTGQKCRMQPLYIFATNYSYNDIFRCQMKCLRWCQSCWKKFRERAVQDSSDKSLEQKLLGQKTKRKRCRRASVDLCVCVCCGTRALFCNPYGTVKRSQRPMYCIPKHRLMHMHTQHTNTECAKILLFAAK